VMLAVEGVPAGIETTLEKIPANGAETMLKLSATEKAPPGTNTLTVVATGLHGDRNFKHKSGAITLIVNAPESTETNAPPATAAATATSAVK
jgi:hypothetical protein